MKIKVLEALKEHSEQYISGEQLSSKLGVSRTMVWKLINELRTEGYEIEASSRKGYRLIKDSDHLSQNELEFLMKKSDWIKGVQYFESIDSTNTYAKKYALESPSAPVLVLADEQILGRGRLGREWHSKAGEGLWFSMILRPQIEPKDAFLVTLIGAVAVTEGIDTVTGLETRIKWPNDVVVNGQKVCGILTELSAEWQTVNYLVVGIGINVNQEDFPEELNQRATSLKLLKREKIQRLTLLETIINRFAYYYQAYEDEAVKENLLEKYRQYSINIGKQVKVIGQETRMGYAEDINERGELMVRFDDGHVEAIYHGEVSVRGLEGYC